MYTLLHLNIYLLQLAHNYPLVHSHEHFRLFNVRWEYHHMPFIYKMLKPIENDSLALKNAHQHFPTQSALIYFQWNIKVFTSM